MTRFPPLTTLVSTIRYGNHTITPRYPSPLLARDGALYVCSRCISLLPDGAALAAHTDACCSRPLPFGALYTQPDGISIGRVTSHRTKQTAALLAMKFIKSKTLFFEIQNYELFVIFREEVLGYFSRKMGGENSLSCLLVFPCFQKQGLGTLLIDYSYAPRIHRGAFLRTASAHQHTPPLSGSDSTGGAAEGLRSAVRRGSSADWNGPEKPLSKSAIMCYRKYWKYRVIGGRTIREISERTNMSVDDVIIGLELQGFDFRRWEHLGAIAVEKPRLLSMRLIRLVEEESEGDEEERGVELQHYY